MRTRPTPRPALGLLLAAGILSLFISACGITLSTQNTGTEIFEELTIAGELTVGEELALLLAYQQPYPVAISVVCDLLDTLVEPEEGEDPEVLARILGETLTQNPNGGPLDEATPVPGTIEGRFAAPDTPGRYVVRCRTEADEDNAIFEEITIVAKRTPEP